MPEKTLTCPRCLSVSPVSAGKCQNCGLPMVRKKKGEKTGKKKPAPEIPTRGQGAPTKVAQSPSPARTRPAPIPTAPSDEETVVRKREPSDQKTTVEKTVLMSPDEKQDAFAKQPAPEASSGQEAVTQKTVFMSDKEKKKLLAQKKKREKAKRKHPSIPLEPEDTPRMQGLELFGDTEASDGGDIGGMAGLERTSIEDTRSSKAAPAKEPQKVQKKPVSDTTRIAEAAKKKPAKKKNPQADRFAPPEENLSMLDLLEDTNTTGGEHFAKQQEANSGGKLDLVQRPPVQEKPSRETMVPKAPIVRPVPSTASEDEIASYSRRSGLASRLIFKVIPLWLLFIAVAFVGYMYIQSLMFTGTWKGVVTDGRGKEVEIELHLKRHQNQIQGDAFYARPEGETIMTSAQRSKIPRVINQVMVNQEGYIIGSFDKMSASFKLFPPGVTDEPSILFEGEFMSKNLLQGSAVNSFQSDGSFMLRRISTWKLPFGLKLP